jgi:Rrf2 family protein
MMKPTAAARYALRAVTHLAELDGTPIVSSHEIARAQGVPERYLMKVLKSLAQAGLLHSLKGPNGGYRLARPAKSITLLEIVEAADGPLRGLVPVALGAAGAGLTRQLAEVCDAAADTLCKELGKVRLSDLAGTPAQTAKA